MAAQSTVALRAIFCPNCGGSVQLRGFAHTLSVTCSQCGTVLDTSTGGAAILAQAQSQEKVQPRIPLGSRGKMENVLYEIIGFQNRYILSYGQKYVWGEYVLFNPYRGFAYFSEYEGHWNFIRPTKELPAASATSFREPERQYKGRSFKPFQKTQATTEYVVGEFPWRVALGSSVTLFDYVHEPYMLSSEGTATETTWSIARYVNGDDVWQAFALPGKPPRKSGVYANQPNPWLLKTWNYFKVSGIFLCAAVVILLYFIFTQQNATVFDANSTFNPELQAEQSLVSQPFTLSGSHPMAVRIKSSAAVTQNWIYLNLSLVNQETNESFDAGESLSYYYGVEDGESWSEGSSHAGTTIYRVPPGRYYLRVDPEREREAGDYAVPLAPIGYHVSVEQGEVNYSLFFVVILLLIVPPVYAWWRYQTFERQRWRESEFSTSPTSETSTSGDDD